MKLGITQLLPRELAQVDQAIIRRVGESGFTGTAFGVNDGDAGYALAERLASSSSAIDPVVTAVAMLVPLSTM